MLHRPKHTAFDPEERGQQAVNSSIVPPELRVTLYDRLSLPSPCLIAVSSQEQ